MVKLLMIFYLFIVIIISLLAVIGLVILILIVIVFIIILFKKWIKDRNFKKNGGAMLKNQIKIYKESALLKATGNYKHPLGKGAFGSVFKGVLPNGTQIAVKKPNELIPRGANQKQIDQQFQREICVISQVNHRNVVKLLGLCLESTFPMLVYEFISNGTVFEHIHKNRSCFFKSWRFCLRIAEETASALNYLHSLADPPIIHRDVKSMNILLDRKLTAKVSDFGTSVLIPPDQTGVPTTVQGTFGYLDPEYLATRILTAKSDVYSFGMVLIELLTGWNPVPTGDPERNLVRQFESLVKTDTLFLNLNILPVDDGEKEQIKTVAELAIKCLNSNRSERPTMKDVAEELDKQMRILIGNSQSGSNISHEATVNLPDIQPSSSAANHPLGKGNATIDMGQLQNNNFVTAFDVELRSVFTTS